MLFDSEAFAVFFPLVVLLHFGLPRGGRVPLLLLAGTVFYGAFVPGYLLVLVSLIARPQPRFLQLLEAFLRMTRSAGTEVWLVLAPYHPDAWSALSADGSMIVQAEDAVRGLGAALRLRVLGSFDPRRAGCPEATEYNDPVHARESCLERLIAPQPPPQS